MASHLGDRHAFAIANTLDAALTHLLVARIRAALTGTASADRDLRHRKADRRFYSLLADTGSEAA